MTWCQAGQRGAGRHGRVPLRHRPAAPGCRDGRGRLRAQGIVPLTVKVCRVSGRAAISASPTPMPVGQVTASSPAFPRGPVLRVVAAIVSRMTSWLVRCPVLSHSEVPGGRARWGFHARVRLPLEPPAPAVVSSREALGQAARPWPCRQRRNDSVTNATQSRSVPPLSQPVLTARPRCHEGWPCPAADRRSHARAPAPAPVGRRECRVQPEALLRQQAGDGVGTDPVPLTGRLGSRRAGWLGRPLQRRPRIPAPVRLDQAQQRRAQSGIRSATRLRPPPGRRQPPPPLVRTRNNTANSTEI
jgi:hypothetical protein